MAKVSTKHIQIDKANATMVGFVATAAFVAAFTLVASKALLSQRSYQSRVIAEKTKALKQLQANNKAADELTASYQAFVSQPINIIGGNPTGAGDRDGDSAKIVLDALPSKYDFPALASSLNKILNGTTFKLVSASGTDDELNQINQVSTKPVEIPFQASVTGNFDGIQDFFGVLERSIRPISIGTLTIAGDDSNLSVSVVAKTYYQPEQMIKITKRTIN